MARAGTRGIIKDQKLEALSLSLSPRKLAWGSAFGMYVMKVIPIVRLIKVDQGQLHVHIRV